MIGAGAACLQWQELHGLGMRATGLATACLLCRILKPNTCHVSPSVPCPLSAFRRPFGPCHHRPDRPVQPELGHWGCGSPDKRVVREKCRHAEDAASAWSCRPSHKLPQLCCRLCTGQGSYPECLCCLLLPTTGLPSLVSQAWTLAVAQASQAACPLNGENLKRAGHLFGSWKCMLPELCRQRGLHCAHPSTPAPSQAWPANTRPRMLPPPHAGPP